MDYISYLFRGSSSIDQQYHRNNPNFPADARELIGTFGSFGGVYADQSSGETTRVSIVDSVVKVTTVSEQLRAPAIEKWDRMRSYSKKTFIATLILSVTGLVGGVTLGIVLHPLVATAAVIGLVALGILGISGLAFYRKMQAEKHLAQWADPVTHVSNLRIKCSAEGFFFAKKAELKGTVVTSGELGTLWNSEMEKNYKKFNDVMPGFEQHNGQLVRNFMKECPLEKQNFEYAFGNRDEPANPETYRLAQISKSFDPVKGQYDRLRDQAKEHVKRIKNEQRAALHRNDSNRRIQLLPYNGLRMLARQQQCSRNGSRNPRNAVRFMRDELIYSAMTAPIEALHRQNEIAINSWAINELQKVKNNKKQWQVSFFKPIQEILKKYKIKEENSSQPQPSAPSVEDNLASIFANVSAPPLQETYNSADFDPNWGISPEDWANRPNQ